MRIIQTHEQTDFDGIASLLGAHLLDESTIPVLPRRLNRNVRAFLTVYGMDLPLADPRDLNSQDIEEVTLVDTQALASIKGMGTHTHVKVIDHHIAKTNLPPDWEVVTQETGANTTIFVEAIEERDLHISMIQATLLLLGIYEDTGSLTYTRTLPRDIRAAAYLLEKGANLTIANNFLNHPLSLKQQEFYDQLCRNAKTFNIQGHSIIIAQGDARDMDEELSTIAHKMRDLLDPDGLILLIDIRGGVQMIARSASDMIDVSKIASHFGGGGHLRASAALIKSRDRSSVEAELLQILHQYIQPAKTVAEIMSRTPQILHPNTQILEIAQRMQRYGYEGYPVVENELIVGLVTRRAVDRAISHKLNLTAASLMEAGNIHVFPDHSIEYLQNLMTDTGWGQIPVVDRDSNAVIGIVTRTDLLKTLTPNTASYGRSNLSDKLVSALPPPRLVLLKGIAESAHELRSAIYIVGGFVRDLLLNHPSLDFDIVVEGNAIELANLVQEKYGGRTTTHKRFGTAKWFLEPINPKHHQSEGLRIISASRSQLPDTLDFITARREFYTHPTALPTIESGSIKLDLHRRDFTINTMAIRLDGHHFGDLHDYWGGHNDLRQGLVRVLHSLSFIDDPTRILRAVRYEQRYNFTLGQRTHDLLVAALPMLERISGDRIRHEIDKAFAEENAIQILDRLNELGTLVVIHPDLVWDSWLEKHISEIKAPPLVWGIRTDQKGLPLNRILAYAIWLMRLPAERAQNVTKRLRVQKIIAETVQNASKLWAALPSMKYATPSVWTSLLDKITTPAIYAVYSACDDHYIKSQLSTYITRWKNVTPQTTGNDLQAYGLTPGPIFKEILTRIRDAWLDGDISTANEETELLKILIDDISNRDVY